MKKAFFFFLFVTFLIGQSFAQSPGRDTVKVGIYITSIHNIDFKQKEYSTILWLWLKYKNKDFNFLQNLEVPNAKSVEKSFTQIDTSNGQVYMQMKLQCVMRDSWRINNFPFDRQTLWFAIENSQFDSRSLIFVPDTVGSHYDPRFTLRDWHIDSCIVSTAIKKYETAFGDESIVPAHTEYSTFRTRVVLTRNASGIFWKIFLGMYIAFLIAFICFFIHADGIDSRFALSVGSLFAVIGNKYIVDSSLPESTTFTLVDALHALTLFFIFTIISATTYTLMLTKRGQEQRAKKFDMLMAKVVFALYTILNVYLIWKAHG